MSVTRSCSFLLVLFAGVFTGCGLGRGTCGTKALASGEISAQVDGEDWTDPAAVWAWTGTGVQVLTTDAGGWRITLVAQRDLEDTIITDLEDSDAFPAEIDLSGEDGFGVIYDDQGSSWSSSGGGSGTLILRGIDEDLEACFDFEAVGSDGTTVAVTAGRVLALEND